MNHVISKAIDQQMFLGATVVTNLQYEKRERNDNPVLRRKITWIVESRGRYTFAFSALCAIAGPMKRQSETKSENAMSTRKMKKDRFKIKDGIAAARESMAVGFAFIIAVVGTLFIMSITNYSPIYPTLVYADAERGLTFRIRQSGKLPSLMI